MSLGQLMMDGLPLNRKERFYTGTVLPMILCCDDFGHFWRLGELLGVSRLHIDAHPLSANVQFFTEYGFAESATTAAAKKKFPAGFPSRETPDLMVFVEGERSYLLALEAKMFHRPEKSNLVEQIHKQQLLLEHIRTSLVVKPSNVAHAALLPKSYAKEVGTLPVPVITWEKVLSTYDRIAPAYFLEILRIALAGYEDLKSKMPATFGANMEAKVSGAEIYDRFHDGTLEYPFMGRGGGLAGSILTQDVKTGNWKTKRYEVRTKPLPANSNWFAVAEFVGLIDRPSGVET